MKINGNELLDRLAAAKKTDRTKVSLYLSKSLYEAFKQRCEAAEIPTSVVLEELLREFVESVKKPRKS